MAHTRQMDQGGYEYIPAVFQYSGGVAALPGFRIERVRFDRVVPLAEGFQRIAAYLYACGRPLTSFCACELRSREPFSEEGFRSFNLKYIDFLREWTIMDGDVNPVARTNVCPEVEPPAEPGFHAFCYTVPGEERKRSFVIAGSGEAPEGRCNYRDHIIRLGETSSEAMRDKVSWVLGEMERRMAAFGAKWEDVTASQIYTVHDIHPFLEGEVMRRGSGRHGVTWHYTRPPVVDLEYEMDCRRVLIEHVLAA